jgi:hypothetical protein
MDLSRGSEGVNRSLVLGCDATDEQPLLPCHFKAPEGVARESRSQLRNRLQGFGN